MNIPFLAHGSETNFDHNLICCTCITWIKRILLRWLCVFKFLEPHRWYFAVMKQLGLNKTVKVPACSRAHSGQTITWLHQSMIANLCIISSYSCSYVHSSLQILLRNIRTFSNDQPYWYTQGNHKSTTLPPLVHSAVSVGVSCPRQHLTGVVPPWGYLCCHWLSYVAHAHVDE